MHRQLPPLAVCLLLLSGVASAQDSAVDYLKEIKPLLRDKCFACHGGLKQNAKLRLDTVQLMRKGGRSGPAVQPGVPDKSLLIERITAKDKDDRMPPDSPPLSPEEVAKIRAWIAQGAVGPAEEQPETDAREHWAFRPVKRPDVPKVKDAAWAKNPIDAFLAAEHAKQGLTPRPAIEKSLLLRRVYLDLIGLPPTSKDMQDFLSDKADDAYEKVVDRLLADPRHGERWGRHWMDVWRYSDWYGRRMVPDVWNSAPQVWRWRDWIVKSVNADKGYARMIQEMLAADEICPEDDDATVATGFLVRNWYALNPNDWMRSNVEHVGKAFLGLTFNCAHCHDHKYDPISHEDYFRFRAWFEPIGIRQDRVPGEADPGPFQEYDYSVLRKVQRLGAVRIYDKKPEAVTWFYTGGDERNRVKEKGAIASGVPAIFGRAPTVHPVELPPEAFYPGLRPALRDTLLQEQQTALSQAEAELEAARKEAPKALPGLREALSKAEAALLAEGGRAKGGPSIALAGKRSLLMDATSGRRALHHGLPGLKKLHDGASVQFELRLLKDTHFNFQLARDVPKGLTAAYVGFDKGRILSYQPGSFTEFEVGRYDLARGEDRFLVTLLLHTKADHIKVSVKGRKDGRILVDRAPVALNGWNPVGDSAKALTFDARPGSVALVDDIFFDSPAGTRILTIDFEGPQYAEGREVAGVEGWSASFLSEGPATSLAAGVMATPQTRAAAEKVRLARRALEAVELKETAALAKKAATVAGIDSLNARIAADEAKFSKKAAVDLAGLSQKAAQAERDAAFKQAEAAVLAKDQALAAAECKPASDPARAKELDAAAKQLTAAKMQLDKARAALAAPLKDYTPLGPVYPRTSTGRRKALAEWIASPANPLTARVAVNHIWLRHFHAPLVASVYDFGRNGGKPSHPELLDYLAAEFQESGWSMKKMHRLIVTSQAYRMASSQGPEVQNAKRDLENRYLWRMNVGRMESEVVRDSLLSLAGILDPTMGGQELENKDALTTRRRSLYYSCHPESDGKSDLGKLFDAPEAGECYRRTRTVVPQQALALTNSDMIHDVSAKVAAALWEQLGETRTPQAFVGAAFERVLSRRPLAGETDLCVDFLRVQGESNTKSGAMDGPARARESLVRSLLNHNDFISIR